MNQTVLLSIILSFYVFRAVKEALAGKSSAYLIVSFFILTIPLEIVKNITGSENAILPGTLSGDIQLNISVILCIAVLCFLYGFKIDFKVKLNSWITIFALLLIMSYFNPYNEKSSATLAFAFFLFSYIFLFHLISKNLTIQQIIKGTYDGLMYLCIFQFILAICFPLLNMVSVTGLFHEGAKDWATRQGNDRSGAVGLFEHPGSLAVFLLIASSFFVAVYFEGLKKSLTLILLVINGLTIILTYSRTAYIAYVIMIFSLYFIKKNAKKNIFSLINMVKVILPITIVIGWLVFFSPFSDQFLKEDSSAQYDNRMLHWLLSIIIFTTSPFIGVGINSHLAFLGKHSSIVSKLTVSGSFYTTNPIHNIHLIVLCETGIIGFFLWFLFIFKNIAIAKKQVAADTNTIMSLSLIGLFLSYLFYGVAGWAPFSSALLPYFLFITFFAIKFRSKLNVRHL